MPIFLRIRYEGLHSWYDYTPALFGGAQVYNYNIDVEAQQAAQAEN